MQLCFLLNGVPTIILQKCFCDFPSSQLHCGDETGKQFYLGKFLKKITKDFRQGRSQCEQEVSHCLRQTRDKIDILSAHRGSTTFYFDLHLRVLPHPFGCQWNVA